MKGKTAMDKQTGKLIAKIAENLPDLNKDTMQWWIENPDALKRTIQESLRPPGQNRKWREKNGVIYFSVTSDGTDGPGWIKRLEDPEGNGSSHVDDNARWVLRSPDFKPTSGVTTKCAILKGTLFKGDHRITKNVRAEADKRKLSKPDAELACLIREKFTNKEIEAMGLMYIVAMHEPINDSGGNPSLLFALCEYNDCWFGALNDKSDRLWHREGGFAFAVSQY
ncbi:MAG: hypothetical protein HYT28_01325 [Parcubacteria group bacterium]|nr:hypothetical protein [Parcubacteria group bacterium]